MTVFRAALEGSVILGPVLRFSTLGADNICQWWRESLPGRALLSLLEKYRFGADVPPVTPAFDALFHPMLLLAGVIGLLLMTAVLDTGVIGLMTWALLAFVGLAAVARRKWPFIRFTVLDGVVLLFFLSAAVSAAFSSFPKESLIGLAKMATFFAGYLVFRALAERRGFVMAVLWTLALIGLYESAVSFDQYINRLQPLATWQDPSINPELQLTRVWGTVKPLNPNLLAGYLIPCFAAATGLMFYHLSKLAEAWRRNSFLACVAAVSAGSILVTLVLTGSRGVFLAIPAMFLVIFLFSGHLIFHQMELKRHALLKWLWIGVLVLGVTGAAFGVGTSEKLQHRVASMFAMREDSSISYRLNVYGSASRMFADNWVVGIGPGNETFKQVYGLYMVPGFNALAAYSVPLEVAVEQGIIGLALFLLMIAVIKMRAFWYVDAPCALQGKIIVGLLFTGISGSLVYGLFDTIWYRPPVNLQFWLLVAVFSAMTERSLLPGADEKFEETGKEAGVVAA